MLGVALAVIALLAAVQVGSVLPLGYDSRAYWLAARHLVDGTSVFPAPNATLGARDEFHYLPIVALPFVATLPLPIGVFVWLWFAVQVVLAIGLGIALIRPLPATARPWATAAYAFFLPTVLEVTLGNLDLVSLVFALLAWHWRTKATRAGFALAAAVGIKFMPTILLPFYVAAGRGGIVLRAVVIGAIGLVATLPFVWQPTLDYVGLIPRYADTAWVRIIVQRDEPAILATLFWSDAFPLALALVAIGLATYAGRMAQRDVAHETEWHHVALALSPYLSPFGFIWTTFLVTTLPLFAVAFGRALALEGARRVAALAALALCWFAMQLVQLHDLMPILWHLVGVFGLVGISLALLGRQAPQLLGRSSPASRATRSASG
jgi:hypothetical protein